MSSLQGGCRWQRDVREPARLTAGCMSYLQSELQLQSMWHHHASVDGCPETLAQQQLRCMCMLPPTAPLR